MARAKKNGVYLDGKTWDDVRAEAKVKYERWKAHEESKEGLWESFSPQDVHALVGHVLRDGAYLGISLTRDGGACCFTVFIDKSPHKLYVASADELEAEVERLSH